MPPSRCGFPEKPNLQYMHTGTHILNVWHLLHPCICRWVLTGTPVQNKLLDLYGYTSFLDFAPANNKSVFTRSLERPVKSGDKKVIKNLQVRAAHSHIGIRDVSKRTIFCKLSSTKKLRCHRKVFPLCPEGSWSESCVAHKEQSWSESCVVHKKQSWSESCVVHKEQS